MSTPPPLLLTSLLLALLAGCPRGETATSGAAGPDEPTSILDGRREVLVDAFTDEQIVMLLNVFGYAPRVVDDGSITFELGSARVMMFNHWDGDLQMYYVMTGGSWEPRSINDWNRTRRHSRAYLDSEGDLVLEADLLSLGGITERQFASFVMLYEKTLELFVAEVVGPGIGRPPPDETDPPDRPKGPPSGWH